MAGYVGLRQEYGHVAEYQIKDNTHSTIQVAPPKKPTYVMHKAGLIQHSMKRQDIRLEIVVETHQLTGKVQYIIPLLLRTTIPQSTPALSSATNQIKPT